MKMIKKLLETLKTYKERAAHKYFIKLSHGNKKLRENKRVSFLVWNIPAVITCPHKTVHCEGFCYARKAERVYPDVLPARLAHLELSKTADFVPRMIYTIQCELDRPKNKNKKIVFRIHESGDFYNKEYTEKWLTIARYFENDQRIVFVAYTKSVCYFDGVKIPVNFCLLASVWDDTNKKNLEIIARNNYRIYTAYKGAALDNALNNGFTLCRCKDCAGCGLCWNNYVANIACEIH